MKILGRYREVAIGEMGWLGFVHAESVLWMRESGKRSLTLTLSQWERGLDSLPPMGEGLGMRGINYAFGSQRNNLAATNVVVIPYTARSNN